MSKDLIPQPSHRPLRVYAFDPSVSAQFDTAAVGEIQIQVRWEENLLAGPIGEYIEVVDIDPASRVVYKPVDLNHEWILARSGLTPSESNPQFHQQMVYAVAMATIDHFEQALGRVAQWSERQDGGYEQFKEKFVRRLRIYPHALRDRNAYYSPGKKALLFGYFPVTRHDSNNAPGTVVFTCLSHDIIAHETAHALLDGVHPRFKEPVNVDVRAFHEAFADIVAIFQHFSYPGVLRDQIARTRGNLANENLLAQLAQQFGKATGRGTALRDALGGEMVTDGGKDCCGPAVSRWQAAKPDVHKLSKTINPHDRGAILVAAVFGAFLKIYRARTLDLYRLATEGTGVLREGDIPPDLTARLADEAASTARHVLQMCIRAIDYCPPVGPTFGDFLRGIVTADYDFNRDDPHRARLAFVDSFRQWGIQPKNVGGLSADELLWPQGPEDSMRALLDGKYEDDVGTQRQFKAWDLESNRLLAWKGEENNRWALYSWLRANKGMARQLGIVLDAKEAPKTINRSSKWPSELRFEVHSVRPALRRSPRGQMQQVLVVEITQKRRGYFDKGVQESQDKGEAEKPEDFTYRAGCTLLIDPESMTIRRLIRTAGDILNNGELERQSQFLSGRMQRDNAFDGSRNALKSQEPFALMHREHEEEF